MKPHIYKCYFSRQLAFFWIDHLSKLKLSCSSVVRYGLKYVPPETKFVSFIFEFVLFNFCHSIENLNLNSIILFKFRSQNSISIYCDSHPGSWGRAIEASTCANTAIILIFLKDLSRKIPEIFFLLVFYIFFSLSQSHGVTIPIYYSKLIFFTILILEKLTRLSSV